MSDCDFGKNGCVAVQDHLNESAAHFVQLTTNSKNITEIWTQINNIKSLLNKWAITIGALTATIQIVFRFFPQP